MRSALLTIIVICFFLGSLLAWVIHAPHALMPSLQGQGRVLIGGPFQLVNHRGEVVTEETYKGKLLLVYFCYTNSLDICPAGAQTLTEVLKGLNGHRTKISTLFISFDPERDTSERLRQFLSGYHPDIIGLRGTKEQIRTAAESYRVYFARDERDTGHSDYQMRHTTQMYLMDRSGKYLAHFNHGTFSENIIKTILKYL